MLGERPHDLRPVLAPVLTVDGLIEDDATEWLAYVHARTGGTKTGKSYAESICVYAAFLIDRNCSLRGATNAHLVGYVNYRTVDDATRVSGTTWYRDRNVIKQFHEWLRETNGIEVPFTVDVVRTPPSFTNALERNNHTKRPQHDQARIP